MSLPTDFINNRLFKKHLIVLDGSKKQLFGMLYSFYRYFIGDIYGRV